MGRYRHLDGRVLLSCHPFAFHSWDPSLAWLLTFRCTDSFKNSHKAVGQLQMFSLLHLRCRGGDAGADHLCCLGQAGWWVASTGKGKEERCPCSERGGSA